MGHVEINDVHMNSVFNLWCVLIIFRLLYFSMYINPQLHDAFYGVKATEKYTDIESLYS